MAITRGRGKKIEQSAGLIITSLIDFFSVVVIYLMKSYSSEGSILTNSDNLVLPNSNATTKPKDINVQISATQDMVLVDQIPVVPTEDIRKIPQTESNPIITKLSEKLKGTMAQEEQMVRMGAANKVEGNVTIQIDKNVEFDVLYKIMLTCGSVGYNKMNFAVMSRKEE